MKKKKNKNWFSRQHVGIRAAIIVATATIIGQIISRPYANNNDFEERVRSLQDFKSQNNYNNNQIELVSFLLDTRKSVSSKLNSKDIEGHLGKAKYTLKFVGNAYPILICAFYNGTNKPQEISGVEIVFLESFPLLRDIPSIEKLEPEFSVDVCIGKGFQNFVPPFILNIGKIGALHVRLVDDLNRTRLPFGVYKIIFKVGKRYLNTPQFLWEPKYSPVK